jgi:hypothetical protein
MNKDVKPTDFFTVPEGMILCPKLPLGLLLEAAKAYFKVYLKTEADRKAKKPSSMQSMILEPLLQDQLLRAVVVLFAQMPEEERHLIMQQAVKTILDRPGDIPNLPNIEELFK